MQEMLQSWAEQRGYRVAWGSLEIARQAWTRIRGQRSSGELDEGFFATELATSVSVRDDLVAGTVVVVAVPRPAHRVGFEIGGEVFDTILPPTYFRYRATFEEVRQDLAVHGLPGARVEVLNAPLKALATSLGVTRYGRNNICFAPGIGSYLQLCGFVTDADLGPAATEASRELVLLDECADCRACRSVCPTGAIGSDRVLLHGERCLTHANEHPGAWPEWVPGRAHHCLLGCLLCQRVCPANPRLPVEDSGVCFSADETRSLLEDSRPCESHAESGVRTKLAWLGQPGAEPVLGRNLRALVAKRRRRAAG